MTGAAAPGTPDPGGPDDGSEEHPEAPGRGWSPRWAVLGGPCWRAGSCPSPSTRCALRLWSGRSGGPARSAQKLAFWLRSASWKLSLANPQGFGGEPLGAGVEPERAQGADGGETSQQRRTSVGDRLQLIGWAYAGSVWVDRWHALPPQPYESGEEQRCSGDGRHPTDRWAPTPPRAPFLVCTNGFYGTPRFSDASRPSISVKGEADVLAGLVDEPHRGRVQHRVRRNLGEHPIDG